MFTVVKYIKGKWKAHSPIESDSGNPDMCSKHASFSMEARNFPYNALSLNYHFPYLIAKGGISYEDITNTRRLNKYYYIFDHTKYFSEPN